MVELYSAGGAPRVENGSLLRPPANSVSIAPTGRFGRSSRLRRPSEFQRNREEGRRISGSSFVLLLATGARHSVSEEPRLGLTVSRKVGNAVVRNHVKRRIREWFRRGRAMLPMGSDLVVVARSSASTMTGREVACELSDMVARLRPGSP